MLMKFDPLETWKQTIKTALKALKESGCLFVAEKMKRFPAGNYQSMCQAGLVCTPARCPDGKLTDKFQAMVKKFTVMIIAKYDYDEKWLLENLDR